MSISEYEIKSKEKSGRVAALLNIPLPGLGYLYAHSWIMMIVAPALMYHVIFRVDIAIVWIFVAWLAFIYDGSLAAGRYNKRLYKKAAKEERKEREQAA